MANAFSTETPVLYRTRPESLAYEPDDIWSDRWQVLSAFFQARTVSEAKGSLASTIDHPVVHMSVVEAITSNLRNFDQEFASALERGDIERC